MKKYFLLMLATILLLLISCNSEGIGIFYQISKEVKQIESKISELVVYQVVEVEEKVYARTGRTAWMQTGSTWTNIGNNNFIYNIVEYNKKLYGVINNDENSLSKGKIMSYNDSTSTWNLVHDYNTDLTLFDIKKTNPDTYILMKRSDETDSTFSSTNLSTEIIRNESIYDFIFDGASAENSSTTILISKSSLYIDTFSGNSFESKDFESATGKSGNFTSIAVDATNNYYLATSSGQIYKSEDDAASWKLLLDITDNPVNGSLEVVSIGTKEYLIIGTNEGYYEMNITDNGSIVTPVETTGVSNFSAAYPDLAKGMVNEIYQSTNGATGNYFYLATSNGLWKRLANGTFAKQ